MNVTLDITLITALIGAISGLFSLWQVNQQRKEQLQQRFDDAIGNEQRMLESMGVRAHHLIMKMADDPQYQPSDSDIVNELSPDILGNSNITHLSYELSAMSINGRVWSREVVHHCRGYFTKLCIEARENKRSGWPIDTENFRNGIISKTIWAAGEASELSRAVRERKSLWYNVWPKPNPYHSVAIMRSPKNNEAQKASQTPGDPQTTDKKPG